MSNLGANYDKSRDARLDGGGVGLLERGSETAASAAPANKRAASPHVISLHGKLEVHTAPKSGLPKEVMPPRGLGRLLHLIDERLHLHDLRMRTLSIRPRGWKDFPPADSKTMRHAVRVTGQRFFNEHPFAELTVLSLAHMLVMAAMHIAQLPGKIVHGHISDAFSSSKRKDEAKAGAQIAPPAAPVEAPVVIPAATVQTPSFKSPIDRPLPLRARLAVWLSPTARKLRRKDKRAEAVLREVSVKPEPVVAPVVEAAAPVQANVVVQEIVAVQEIPAVQEAAPAPAPAPAPKPQRAPLLRLQSLGWQRPLAGFVAVAAFVLLPFAGYGAVQAAIGMKDRVIEKSVGAVQMLKSAGSAAQDRDFASASRTFAQAEEGFEGARKELGALAGLLNAAPSVFPGTRLSAAAPLLNAAQEIAQGGEHLTNGMAAADAMGDPASKINSLQAYFADALPHLEKASQELDRVNADAVPAEYRSVVAEAKRSVPQLTEAVRKAGAIATVLGDIMGQNEPKRYLVIFQNNAELRPTGGFMGSFALMDISKGKVTSMEIPGGGTYDIKGQTARVRSPQPLHLINPLWQFQDSNWFADFPTSAKQISWFYSKSGGPTTDGVIAINATLMEELLKVTGPIDMPEYGKVITAENFYAETQHAVEVGYDKAENKPKQFVADLGPKVLDRLMNGGNDQLLKLAGIMDDALLRREVQIWLTDAEAQERVSKLGWGGEMKSTDGDFLSIVHTNIAGQKTDRVITDDVQHSVKVLPDGTGIVTLTLTRTHKGVKGEAFSGVRNVDYVRFYVPQGSTLVEARGFTAPDPKLFKMSDGSATEDPAITAAEKSASMDRDSGTRIGTEGDKTVFGNWMMTDPGQSSTVTLVYQLPAGTVPLVKAPEGRLASFYGKLVGNRRDRLDYSLLVQKQAGTNPMTVTSSVDLPRGYSPSWQSPQRTLDERGRWTITAELDRDAFLASVAEGL